MGDLRELERKLKFLKGKNGTISCGCNYISFNAIVDCSSFHASSADGRVF